MKKKITELNVKDKIVGVLKVNNIDYISLTDIAKAENASEPSFVIKNWLRKMDTINYVGLWEQLHNSTFNLVEFDQIKKEYGRNSFSISPNQWIKRTNSIGIVASSGRYSIGTFAHPDILHLIVLNNLEILNADMIERGISQEKRLIKLNEIARKHMKLLINNKSIRLIEKNK